MGDVNGAVDDATAAAKGGLGMIAATLAERVGGRAGVGAVFGDPVERDGVTVIPVGAVRWGFGGGGGGAAGEEGSGGGGGAVARPIGYIEIADGAARFRRIGPSVPAATLLGGAVAVALMLRSLRALVR